MLPRRHLDLLLPALGVILLETMAVVPVHAQQARREGLTPKEHQVRKLLQEAGRRARSAKHGTEPKLVGQLSLLTYSVEVTDDHSPRRAPREIRITEVEEGHTRVIYKSREQDEFLYMFPLNGNETLLATVWSTATTPTVRIFHISNNKVELVMNNASVNAMPQFVQGGDGAAELVMLGRGRTMQGNLISATREQIWQWDKAADKFILRATVPYALRWSKVSSIMQHGGE